MKRVFYRALLLLCAINFTACFDDSDNPNLTKLYIKRVQEILSYILYRNNRMEIVYK